MSNRILNHPNERCHTRKIKYANCPACGAHKSIPVSWSQLTTWHFDNNVTLKQADCVVCGSSRTVAKIEDGKVTIVLGEVLV